MDLNETIIGVIYLPRKFVSLGNVSIRSLLKATGYFEMKSQVSENAIREALIRHPECIHEWMLLSADKRSRAGWYFKQDEKENYIVGYYSPNDGVIRKAEYSDPIHACAVFIKHEIEDVRA